MPARLVALACLVFVLAAAAGAAQAKAAPPQPLKGNPADRMARLPIDDYRDHVHLGLSRAGAAMRTSFWR